MANEVSTSPVPNGTLECTCTTCPKHMKSEPNYGRLSPKDHEKIEDLLMKGWTLTQIERHLCPQLGVSREAIRQYIVGFWAREAKEAGEQRQNQISNFIVTCEAHFKRCIESGDNKTATSVLSILAKAKGADLSRVEVNHNGQIGINIDFGNLNKHHVEARLFELVEKNEDKLRLLLQRLDERKALALTAESSIKEAEIVEK